MSNDTTTAVSLLAKLNAGEITSEEIVRPLLERSDRLNRLRVFVHHRFRQGAGPGPHS